MDNQATLFAFLLTLIAGLSTGIGSLITFVAKRTNSNFRSSAPGLSAGVMIFISPDELLPQHGEIGQAPPLHYRAHPGHGGDGSP